MNRRDLCKRIVAFGLASRTSYLAEIRRGITCVSIPNPLAAASGRNSANPLCPVCSMDADPDVKSVYKGKTYSFCMPSHKEAFDKAPESFASVSSVASSD